MLLWKYFPYMQTMRHVLIVKQVSQGHAYHVTYALSSNVDY